MQISIYMLYDEYSFLCGRKSVEKRRRDPGQCEKGVFRLGNNERHTDDLMVCHPANVPFFWWLNIASTLYYVHNNALFCPEDTQIVKSFIQIVYLDSFLNSLKPLA